MTLRWSDADYAAYVQAKTKPAERKARVDYVPYRERKGGMNKLEAAYAQQLEVRRQAGEVRWWSYEPIRLRLADGTFYKPDFLVVTDTFEIHETKGFMREAARVRLNVAADKFPFRFYLVRKKPHGQWDIRLVNQANRESPVLVPCGTQGDAPCSPDS